mmetsp:Transcript_82450/g.137919  ORF Transcript_82450/g.137919 Transcript_82450/m.137919 type:complete len:92 (+) Transcript_82450:547-822(+)
MTTDPELQCLSVRPTADGGWDQAENTTDGGLANGARGKRKLNQVHLGIGGQVYKFGPISDLGLHRSFRCPCGTSLPKSPPTALHSSSQQEA